jgi:peptidoglycan/xylan/chitin deacetylase (PgdA/CDA1 family)
LPGRFGGSNEWDEGHLPLDQRDALMTEAEMAHMAQSPYVTFGSHGMMHQHFPELNEADLHHELHESHRLLSECFPNAYVPVLAYPWGEYSSTVLQALEHGPYQLAMTVETAVCQADTQPLEMPRFSGFYRDGNPLVLKLKLLRHGLINWSGKVKAVR